MTMQITEPGAATEAPRLDLAARSLVLRGSVDLEKRECSFVASTNSIDSYDEIVEQTWDLTRFKANPVILFGHNSRELPIGQATECGVVKGELVCTIKFASAAANPLAEQVFQSVKEGSLRAVSVGFYPRSVRYEKRDDKEVYVLSDNELHEISVVPVPANADCVARMRGRAAGAPGAPGGPARARQASRDTSTSTPSGVATPTPPAVAGDSQKEEKNMKTIEQLQAEVAQRDAQIINFTAAADVSAKAATAASEKIAGLETRFAALTTQNETLVKERDAAVSAEKTASSKVVELEVGALVGVKITPAEKDTFVKLKALDPALFDAMVTQRAPMTILDKIVTAEKSATNSAAPSAVVASSLDLVAQAKSLPPAAV